MDILCLTWAPGSNHWLREDSKSLAPILTRGLGSGLLALHADDEVHLWIGTHGQATPLAQVRQFLEACGHTREPRTTSGVDALNQLFRAALGILSPILPPHRSREIFSSEAQLAIDDGLLSGHLRLLVAHAMATAGHHAVEADRLRLRASACEAARALADRVFNPLAARTACLVGGGATGAAIAHELLEAGVGRLLFAAGGDEDTGVLPTGIRALAVPARFPECLRETDLVILADQAVTTAQALEAISRSRPERPLVVYDTRQSDSRNPHVPDGVFLYGVGDLKDLGAEQARPRIQEMTKLDREIRITASRSLHWLHTMTPTHLRETLKQRASALSGQQMERHGKRLDPLARTEVAAISDSFVHSVLDDVTATLDTLQPDTPEGSRQMELLCRLFNLQPPTPDMDNES